MNIEYLTYFFALFTCMIPDFLYVIKYKKKENIKHNFEKDRLNLLNKRRKINKKGKTKVLIQYEKLKKNCTIFPILLVSQLYKLLQKFSKVF